MSHADAKPDLRDLTPQGVRNFLLAQGEKPFRARQVLGWLYRRGAADFAAMSDLSKNLRQRLDQTSRLTWLAPAQALTSQDGTRKLLYILDDGAAIESVLIPEDDHHTLCLSTQVGCRQGCKFCRTTGLGFSRNLRPAEIVGQVLTARTLVDEARPLTNLVFMGMGEPLDNLGNLLVALGNILGNSGLAMSQRRVTVSTVGLAEDLAILGRNSPAALAVSVNATTDTLRSKLMPVNRRWSLQALKAALMVYPLKPTRRITLEYVLLGGVNDSPDQARKLALWARGLRCKVNLIPYNPHEGARFQAPTPQAVAAFQEVLLAHNLTALMRDSRGRDIGAACGQLAGRANPTDRLT